jgi:hypothetical protein
MGAAAVVGLLAAAACPVRPGPADVPAVLVNPTAECRAELARVASSALNGAPVTLADDALVRADELIVQRAPHRDSEGRPLDGRETGRPEHFRLVRNDSRCVLVQESTGRRWTLTSADCSPR